MSTVTWDADQTFRDLYTRLGLLGTEQSRIVGITSAIQGEGKTTITAKLANARALDFYHAHVNQSPGKVVIVDCNGGFAAPNEFLEREPALGLIQYLRGECQLSEAMTPVWGLLSVISRGGKQEDLASIMRSVDLVTALKPLREHARVTLLDLPDVLTRSDTQLLIGAVDSVLVVVRARATPSDLVERALAEIDEDKLAGVVLNDVKSDLPEWLDRRL